MVRMPFRSFRRHSAATLALGFTAILITGLLPGLSSDLDAQSVGELAVGNRTLGKQALAQMAAVHAQKTTRSVAERKLSTDLLVAVAQQQRAPWLGALPALRMEIVPNTDGTVTLDLRADIDAALLARIRDLGGTIVNAHAQYGAARVRLPLDQVPTLAEDAAVRFVRSADRMLTQMANVTEGDIAHTADTARVNFGVDGAGVMTCAMSDSVDALAQVQGTGDLPPTVFVLPGQSGNPGTSEGTALLEIIHDMAPGADLGFATGSGGEAQMAQNILDLAAAGCDVIVDDVLYLGELVFQDGIIAQAVDQVVTQDIDYFSAAGNSGNLTNGTSGVFEGDYTGIALPAPLVGAAQSAHDFGGGNAGNTINFDPPVLITLQWADPAGASNNDYDLFLLDAALANVIAFSTFTQNGNDLPLEFIDSSTRDDTGNRLVVTKFGGDDRFFHMNTHRGRLNVGTNGQIFGHPAAEGALAVGAVDVASANGGPFTGGAANPSEFFSSDGPRRIFFEPDGSPVATAAEAPLGTIANPKYTITNPKYKVIDGPAPVPQRVREKPDVAAADGVSTATPGFNPFFGSSASAPHSAAIAALFQDLFPSIPVDDRYDIFRSTALDIDDPGFDDNSGDGIMMGEDSLAQPIFSDGFESGDTSAWTQ